MVTFFKVMRFLINKKTIAAGKSIRPKNVIEMFSSTLCHVSDTAIAIAHQKVGPKSDEVQGR